MYREHVLYDAKKRPVAVQIPYTKWQHIEKILLSLKKTSVQSDLSKDLSKYKGILKLTIDPLTFQKQIRGEW